MRVSCFQNRPSKEIDFHRPCRSSIRGIAAANAFALLLLLTMAIQMTRAQATQKPGATAFPLKAAGFDFSARFASSSC